jgi:hypothetical protein
MSTPKQIAASRANGARSKGPVTEQGKRNSSGNSTRHGLFAETIVLENEKEDEFIELLNELLDEHQPQTPTETIMVEAIAAARWRQDRIWGMQKVAFDHDVSSSPSDSNSPPLRAVLALRVSPENIRTHELLLRYEIAFDRQISRALLRLQQLQDRRARRKEEWMAPQSIEPEESAKGAARTSVVVEEPIARHSVLRGSSKDAPAKRTQQNTETKRSASAPAPKPAAAAVSPLSRMGRPLARQTTP